MKVGHLEGKRASAILQNYDGENIIEFQVHDDVAAVNICVHEADPIAETEEFAVLSLHFIRGTELHVFVKDIQDLLIDLERSVRIAREKLVAMRTDSEQRVKITKGTCESR